MELIDVVVSDFSLEVLRRSRFTYPSRLHHTRVKLEATLLRVHVWFEVSPNNGVTEEEVEAAGLFARLVLSIGCEVFLGCFAWYHLRIE